MSEFEKVYGGPVSEIGRGVNVWGDQAEQPIGQNMSLFNMTQVTPKVTNKKLQDVLNKIFIGCRGRERSEDPHVTIRVNREQVARVRLSDGHVMSNTGVHDSIVEVVKRDVLENNRKYVENWNENNPSMAIPLVEEQQDELREKEESYKETAWYKEAQQLYAPDEERKGQA